ncbi:Bug family tripartite tricarboxylate transporter substrate binding protein [Neoroseomonas oryzicola]|uniref:Tripartite tricarboxylate transporter substrate binding protein n=2 Tax=Neoroseomonas oryzicola TaxID=535904 RepID=A0A9X9WLA7_9PROT|nr:tripartite tricarboxylate transporter substrate binding protein [Neoroseomonas oryzicola]MBR0661117.1 tripartite tricarboxylate transporter substrate binding protein [Neoroseomonas oryzicola]NKE17445.1 tripartite tricarboxylate transporter substrate binding protein [Neoroseomonas oryzicola]
MMNRRTLLAAAGSLPLAAPVLGQSPWPNKPVRVIVGFPPGGSLDVMTRLACEQMQSRFGQAFVVETRSGASGNIGAEAIARATPDGYTIGTISMHNLLINPLLFTRLPYDARKDFAWISAMWDLPNVAVVPAQHVPARTVAEFVTWAKARPNGVSYGSSGVGTTIHLSGAYLMAQAGIRAEHVTFRGAAQTIPAMLSGDIQIAVDNLASYVPVIQEGRMRPLAVTTRERWPGLPDVPTMAEAGFAGLSYGPWHLWAAPAGTPRAMIDRLSQEIRTAFADQALQQRAIGMGARLLGTTPEQLAERLERERPIWAEMVRISGAQPE